VAALLAVSNPEGLPMEETRARLLSPLVMKMRRGTEGDADRRGMHASVRRAVPETLVSKAELKAARSAAGEESAAMGAMPALLMRTERCGVEEEMVEMQEEMEESEVRSSCTGWMVLLGRKEGRVRSSEAAVCPLERVRLPR
jgi:hypothetical protein